MFKVKIFWGSDVSTKLLYLELNYQWNVFCQIISKTTVLWMLANKNIFNSIFIARQLHVKLFLIDYWSSIKIQIVT